MAITQTELDDFGIVFSLGELMRKAREDAGLKQGDVATALGVSDALVGHWEKNRSEPSYRRLVKFADLTGFPLDALLSAIGYVSQFAGEPPDLTVIDGRRRGPIKRSLPFLASVPEEI